MTTPAERIVKRVPQLRTWLASCGAQVLEPTNEYEVARFKAGDETCVIYRNKIGGIKHNGMTGELALKAFLHGKAWRAAPPTSRRKKMSPMVAAIKFRDGDLCFFCQEALTDDTESVEHLVSVTHGGPNHLANLFLAHKLCNARAGHLSAPEKIRMHVSAVMKKNAIQEVSA